MKTHKLILLAIIVLSGILRFWQLGRVPISPDWDEAALGYNAYSILKTGRDEYGTKFPLVLRSFDDYKPPLYAYLTIPSVAAFGLSPWSVRLPSAIAGMLAVLGTYLLVLELFRKNYKLSLVVAALLAISPWHIQFSRIAFEANIGLTLNIWGLVFFFWGLRQVAYLSLSAGIFGLALYAYHSERIFVPLLVILLLVFYHRQLLSKPKKLFLPIMIGLLVVLPLVPVFLNKTTLTRLKGTSALSDQTRLLERSVSKLEEDQKNGNPWGVVFDNRRITWVKTVFDGYLSHYSLRWWFFTGDNDRHHAPGMGLLHVWELPLLLYGIYLVVRRRDPTAKLILGWFLLAPIAAAPTSETPHAIRSLVFLPTFQIFAGLALVTVYDYLKKLRKKVFLLPLAGIYGLLIIYNFCQYLDLYFVQQNREYSQNWQYGYAQAVNYARIHYDQYEKIVVSTKLEQPHMFFLFYLQYDPVKYLAEGGTASGGFAEKRNKFDKYEFRPIDWDQEVHNGKRLYIGIVNEIMHPLETINYLDGTMAIRIGE